MQERATVTWLGSIKEGMGSISTESGAVQNAPYTYATRFENQKGTNPEELIAAAHAACFSMALSGEFGRAGFEAKKIDVSAIVTIEKINSNWTITSSHLEVDADVPNISEEQFQKAAQDAKNNCPVSRLLKAEVSMNARLQRAI